MKTLVAVCLLLWGAVHHLPWRGVWRSVAAGRVDDLICLPLLLALVTIVQRCLPGRRADWRLPVGHALAALVLVSVLFEGLLPRVSPRYTADPLDVACYAAGTVLFLLVRGRTAAPVPAGRAGS